MVFTNIGRSGTQRFWLGATTDVPDFCEIGIGSGAVLVGNTALITATGARAAITTTDSGTTQILEHTFDFSSIFLSGVLLREFGLFTASSVGDMWQREGFNSITFDGTNEAQLVIKLEAF